MIFIKIRVIPTIIAFWKITVIYNSKMRIDQTVEYYIYIII